MSSSEHEDVKRTIRALVGVIQSASQGGSPVDHNQVDHVRKVVRLLSLSHEQVSHMPLPLTLRTHRIAFCLHRLPQVDSTQCSSAEALLPCKPTHTHACSVFLRRRSLTCVSRGACMQIDAMPAGEREQVLSIRQAAVQKMKMAQALHGSAYGGGPGGRVSGSSSQGGGSSWGSPRFPASPRSVGFGSPGAAAAAAAMPPPPKVGPRACFPRSEGAAASTAAEVRTAAEVPSGAPPVMGPPQPMPPQPMPSQPMPSQPMPSQPMPPQPMPSHMPPPSMPPPSMPPPSMPPPSMPPPSMPPPSMPPPSWSQRRVQESMDVN